MDKGYQILRGVFGRDEIDAIVDGITVSSFGGHRRGGIRNPLAIFPQLIPLAYDPKLKKIVEKKLSDQAQLRRAILFDKTPDSNWKVSWHQDLTIAVSEKKVGTDGYGPWSIKNGIPHVQPPLKILERMLTLRIHLDDCSEQNGALKVVANSHRSGKLPAREIQKLRKNYEVCECLKGDVLLMSPLLLHASSISRNTNHRRILHLEYCDAPLDGNLEWGICQQVESANSACETAPSS